MKTLFVLRHAKSSWENPDWSDFERPLNSHGLDSARFIGGLIYERGLQPQIIVSSPAKRAKQTAVLVKEIAEVSKPVKFDERIYEASPLALFNLIREFDEKWESALIVGHNPGFENLVRMLTGETVSMPTAALARINLEIENWHDLETNSNELEFLIRPKEEMKKSVAN
ncbi:MAG TPA: histidine phosphatase family protein [Pyrinomonadaceae bacterium]|nr:histidine phosphatase family protein [Pyrinomonadaceae bacterium]